MGDTSSIGSERAMTLGSNMPRAEWQVHARYAAKCGSSSKSFRIVVFSQSLPGQLVMQRYT
jgi:hypothetical protein